MRQQLGDQMTINFCLKKLNIEKVESSCDNGYYLILALDVLFQLENDY